MNNSKEKLNDELLDECDSIRRKVRSGGDKRRGETECEKVS